MTIPDEEAVKLPCRKCGSNDNETSAQEGWYFVECQNCNCITKAWRTPADAIAAWNRRALSPTAPDTQAPGSGETGWQDIATAPRNGTHVLVKFEGQMSPPTTAHWFEPVGSSEEPGWFLSVQQNAGPPIHPTHWAHIEPRRQGFTQEQAEIVAEVIWQDFTGRHAGPWPGASSKMAAAIQCMASARAALYAALGANPLPAETQAGDNEEMKK